MKVPEKKTWFSTIFYFIFIIIFLFSTVYFIYLHFIFFFPQLRSEWILVFWITFIVYVIGTVLYCLMLSGEPQHWAVDDEDEEARDTL